MDIRTPDKLPDPWLFDSEKLLRDLNRCRELVLQILVGDAHATHFGINIAVTALWNLRDTLRHLLRLHREGQRAFALKATQQPPNDRRKHPTQATATANAHQQHVREKKRRS
jgi:hypothetical protein